MGAASGDTQVPSEGAGGRVPGLEGLAGRLRLEVGGDEVGILEVHDGEVHFHRGGGPAEAVASCDSLETLTGIARGTVNPVVASLQNRLSLSGDRQLAVRTILGLHGGSPLFRPANKGG